MKRFLFIAVAILMIQGCGSNDNAAKQESLKVDYTAKAVELLNQGDVPNAVINFQKAIQEAPQDVQRYTTLAQLYLRLQQYERAAALLVQAVSVDPNNGETFYLLSMAYGFQQDFENAKQSAQRSAQIFSEARDEANFRKALILLKSFDPQPQAAAPASEAVQ